MALALTIFMAVTHLLAGNLRFLHVVPRSRWLSGAGGVSVAYVCLYLLPEIRNGSDTDSFVWLLAGVTCFYIVERQAILSARAGSRNAPGLFWISIIAFSVYNALIAYLMVRQPDRVLYAVAMSVHFIVNDYGLRERYQRRYDTVGRWALASAVLLGGGAASLVQVPEMVLASMLAFIAGGIVLNVFKEELPDERESRPVAFLVGVAAFGTLLLAV